MARETGSRIHSVAFTCLTIITATTLRSDRGIITFQANPSTDQTESRQRPTHQHVKNDEAVIFARKTKSLMK